MEFGIKSDGLKCCIGSIYMVCIQNNPLITINNIISKKDALFLNNYLQKNHQFFIYEIKVEEINKQAISDLEFTGILYFTDKIKTLYQDNFIFNIYIYKFNNLDKLIESVADKRFNFIIEPNNLINGAFILAKIIRETYMNSFDLGTGYSNDPKTKKYLKTINKCNFDKNIVRVNWKNVKQILQV